MKQIKNSNKGFTLVEMLGVLAIIAILISVIAVGVLAAINRARIVATVANFKNLETAVVGFVALPNSGGTVPLTTGTVGVWSGTAVTPTTADTKMTLDQPLRASGLIDRQLGWRVGSDGNTQVNLAAEYPFALSRNAWVTSGTYNGATVGAGNDWSAYNRTVCWPCDITATAGAPAALPIDATTAGSEKANFYLDGVSPLKAARVALVVLTNVSLKDAKKLSAELNGSLDQSEFQDDQFAGRLVYKAPTGTETTTTVYYYLASF